MTLSLLQAKALFLKGAEHERAGKLYEAIQFYKRAVQLVPDVEFKLYESTKSKPRMRLDTDKSSDGKPIILSHKHLNFQ